MVYKNGVTSSFKYFKDTDRISFWNIENNNDTLFSASGSFNAMAQLKSFNIFKPSFAKTSKRYDYQNFVLKNTSHETQLPDAFEHSAEYLVSQNEFSFLYDLDEVDEGHARNESHRAMYALKDATNIVGYMTH